MIGTPTMSLPSVIARNKALRSDMAIHTEKEDWSVKLSGDL
jgi:hypothetical protein